MAGESSRVPELKSSGVQEAKRETGDDRYVSGPRSQFPGPARHPGFRLSALGFSSSFHFTGRPSCRSDEGAPIWKGAGKFFGREGGEGAKEILQTRFQIYAIRNVHVAYKSRENADSCNFWTGTFYTRFATRGELRSRYRRLTVRSARAARSFG